MKYMKAGLMALVLSILLAPAAVLAEKGGKHGKGNDDFRQERSDHRRDERRDSRGNDRRDDHRRESARVELRFGEQDRRVVSDYYGGVAKGGKCPPGLAKKGNGCMPPGQARKWAMGRPLPRDLAYYDLPYDLMVGLPPTFSGHRYVRVAGDVLMIAVGTSMVVDAMQDILR